MLFSLSLLASFAGLSVARSIWANSSLPTTSLTTDGFSSMVTESSTAAESLTATNSSTVLGLSSTCFTFLTVTTEIFTVTPTSGRGQRSRQQRKVTVETVECRTILPVFRILTPPSESVGEDGFTNSPSTIATTPPAVVESITSPPPTPPTPPTPPAPPAPPATPVPPQTSISLPQEVPPTPKIPAIVTPLPPNSATDQQPGVPPVQAFTSTFGKDSNSAFIIGGQTLVPGSAVTVNGATISLAPSASAVIVGSQTLVPGSVITANGETISFAPSGSAIIINGQTTAAPLPTGVLTFGSVTVPFVLQTGPSRSQIVIGSQTLTPGGVITTAGETISLAPGGSSVIIISGGRTTTERISATFNPTKPTNSAGQYLPAGAGTRAEGSSILLASQFLVALIPLLVL